MKGSAKKTEEVEARQALGSYTEAWSSRVINTLLTEFEAGNEILPKGFSMKGVNMVDQGDDTFVVGFVVKREAV